MKIPTKVQGYFQEQYALKCKQIGEPLSANQIGALEKLLGEVFGARILDSPHDFKPFDPQIFYKVKVRPDKSSITCITNILTEYTAKKPVTERGIPDTNIVISDKEVLEVYELAKPQYEKITTKFKLLGGGRIQYLERYLQQRGLIDKC